LIAALLEQEGGLASSILVKAGVQVDSLLQRLDADLERLPKSLGTRPPGQIRSTSRRASIVC
jgi:ATP-dependent Clp protease ATP-binding subunit ClpB